MRCYLSAVVTVLGLWTAFGQAADWPQFRYDAGRTAASPEQLPDQLHVQWVWQLPSPQPAFPHEVRLLYDASYEPVVVGKRLLLPSMVTDSVTALDTQTGRVLWRFFAGGPVRFAPVATEESVYFASDDGYLYCLDIATGLLRWKFRELPPDREDRKLLGNGRLISLWPARGGPVLAGGRIYFAAGLWPGDGVFVHALDAKSGQPVWSNTDSNLIPEANMDHGIGQYAGIAPQGYLAVAGGRLVVPCGAQLPAFLDLQTGQMDEYFMGWGGRNGLPKGSWFAAGVGKWLSHSGDLYDMSRQNEERFRQKVWPRDFKHMLYPGGFLRVLIDPTNQKGLGPFRQPVLTAEAMYINDHGAVVAYDLPSGKLIERDPAQAPPPRRNDQYPDQWKMEFPELWRLATQLQVQIKAGTHLYLGGPGAVAAVRVAGGSSPEIVWQEKIEGTVHRMLAADGKLFVVTREGRLYAFGPKAADHVVVHKPPAAPAGADERSARVAADILGQTHVTSGIAVALGIGSGELIEQLLRQSDLYVIGVDRSAKRVDQVRRRLDQAGLYGTRASVHVGDPLSFPLPPLLASLVVSASDGVRQVPVNARSLAALLHLLRPYGGVACLALSDEQRAALPAATADLQAGQIHVAHQDQWTLIRRSGPLPGAADWSHPMADAANTNASADQVLRPPLALLWFDGAKRWHRKPGSAEVRVAGGRILIKSEQLLAVDVYTGRTLWEVPLPFRHQPTDQLVALEHAVYVTGGKTCLVLDPATGKQLQQFELPAELPGPWVNLRVVGNRLVGQSGKFVVCVDAATGQLVWQHACQSSSLSIAVGGGKVFCAELPNKRRGPGAGEKSATAALDLQTGQPVWQITGSSPVRYSELHDLLVTSHGIYRGADGQRVVEPTGFDKQHGKLACSPLSLVGDRLLWGTPTSFVVHDLRTGKRLGDTTVWIRRGCTDLRACPTLVTTRFKGNSAYIDLAERRAVSLWNIRPACKNNMFPADGVLNIPCLTGGCECNYTPASQAYVPEAIVRRGF